jgi:hypothetical protein
MYLFIGKFIDPRHGLFRREPQVHEFLPDDLGFKDHLDPGHIISAARFPGVCAGLTASFWGAAGTNIASALPGKDEIAMSAPMR